MKKVSFVLLTVIAMAVIMLGAATIYKSVIKYRDIKFEKERQARVEEVSAVTEAYYEEILDIAKLSTEEIAEYIAENAYVDEDEEIIEVSEDPWEVSESTSPLVYADEEAEHSSDTDGWESGTSEENVDRVAELGTAAVEELNKQNEESDLLDATEKVTDDESEESDDPEEVKDEKSEDKKDGSEKSDDPEAKEHADPEEEIEETEDMNLTLAQRQRLRSSAEETALWVEADKEVLADNEEDFSSYKIACLGDSITEAANLLEIEGYEQYTYPTRLKEMLNCAEVYNFGIGGSSLGRFWYEPFCERYDQIPKDVDIILIMGGTNDGYCMSEEFVGNITERAYRTLYGDVNDLMQGLKNDYPDAEVIFITPMPNLLHDVLRKERENLLPQTVVVNCILELADEYGYEVIDLYNSNFFDSHDAEIVADYIPDSVHPNEKGYELLAQHIAAEIVRLHEAKNVEAKETEIEEEHESRTVIYSRDDEDDEDSDLEDDEEDSDAEDREEDEDSDSKEDINHKSDEKLKKDADSADDKEDSKSKEDDSNSKDSKTVIYERD